jgi:hypothetical protein
MPAIREMMLEHLQGAGAQNDARAHASYAATGGVATRVFAHEYRASKAGNSTGMLAHIDRHTIYGALTVYLGPNNEVASTAGVYHTYASAPVGPETARVAHPLRVGQAIVVSPYVAHGVESVARRTSRLTINVFF